MGRERRVDPAAFFCAVTYGDRAAFLAAASSMSQLFGEEAGRLSPFPFDHTDYYEDEMGTGLQKFLVLYRKPRDPLELPSLKRATNALEASLSHEDGRRRVNLDPGYFTPAKVVLATTKDFSHRLYLGEGIYGELTLSARDGAFQPHPWTYPDYRQESVRQFLWRGRSLVLSQAPAAVEV